MIFYYNVKNKFNMIDYDENMFKAHSFLGQNERKIDEDKGPIGLEKDYSTHIELRKTQLPPVILYPQKIIKMLQLKKSRARLQNNRTQLKQRLLHAEDKVNLKQPTTLTNKRKNQIFAHINPRVYEEPMMKKPSELSLPRLRPALLMPELEPSHVLNDYKIISHVGKGCFSVVSSAVEKESNVKFAIKTYNRIDQMDDIKLKNIQNQVQNLFTLHHDNIISLKHAVKDGRKIQLIMQNGGQQSLSGLLRKTSHFQQQTAKKYFRQLADAMAYCHRNNVCHRDIKLQNILVDDFGKLKLIDFGFSLKCNRGMRLTSFCGTPPYMSPQIASRSPYNGQSSDVWALGVTLYLMLTGKFPFRAGNQKELYRLIQQGKFSSQKIPLEAKTLLQSLLKVNQQDRISAQDIVNSSWLKV